MVSIVADSTCDLSQELLDKYKVKMIPLHILLGEKEYEDGVDLRPEEIYAWAQAHPEVSVRYFGSFRGNGYADVSAAAG